MSGAEVSGGVPQLYVASAPEPVTAAQATGSAADIATMSVGLLSSPVDYLMVRCERGLLSTAEGPASLDDVFALRLFSPAGELRWVHDEGGRGTAVLVSETATAPARWLSRRVDAVTVLDGRYALWGRRFETHPDTPGWCRALEGRIGYLDIPAVPPEAIPARATPWPAAYLELRTREYIGRDQDGNAFVCEERLVEIVPAAPELG